LIDGTPIDATVPTRYVAWFRGCKGATQNVLIAVTPNKCFPYVMSRWEDSTNGFTVLKDALSLPPPHGLQVYEGGLIIIYIGEVNLQSYKSLKSSNREILFLRH